MKDNCSVYRTFWSNNSFFALCKY